MIQSDEQKSTKESNIHQTKEDDNKIIPKTTCKRKIACISKTKKRAIRADTNF